MKLAALLATALTLAAASASALTVQEVVALSKGGVSDEVVVALIEREAAIFPIESEQLLALQRAGVSERVVLAMLRSGRQSPAASSAPAPQPPTIAPPAPEMIVVGHGPDRPNTSRTREDVGDTDASTVYTLPYVPYSPGGRCRPPRPAAAHAKTDGIRDASRQFVNSTLYPLLLSEDPPVGGCRSNSAAKR